MIQRFAGGRVVTNKGRSDALRPVGANISYALFVSELQQWSEYLV